MRKKFSYLFITAILLTISGFILDQDPVTISFLMQVVEFLGMLSIIFTLISILYFSFYFAVKFASNKIRK